MKLFLSALISICFLACGHKEKKGLVGIERDYFSNFLISHNSAYTKFKKVIIIPGSGCTGCISGAESYFSKNYEDNSNLYIFTAIGDVKVLKLKFPGDILNRGNVLVDGNNEMVTHGFTSPYPSIAEIQPNDELVKLSTFTE